jgi:hypothetical protein
MRMNCPHCGADLPAVRDAFCSECFQPLEDASSRGGKARSSASPGLLRKGGNPLGMFSVPARVVIVLSILGAAGGTLAYLTWASDTLPPGRYPFWFFALPVLVAAGLLCGIGLAVLRACGVSIYRQEKTPPTDGLEN